MPELAMVAESTPAVGSETAAGTAKPVVLFVVNVAWFFVMHRLHLAQAAQAAGYEVHVATAPDTAEAVQEILEAGLHYHEIPVQRGKLNFVLDLSLVQSLYRLYRTLRPALVHHVTIKPVLFGTLAARLARVPAIVNAMSGLGFVFLATGLLAAVRRKAVMTAYRLLFARRALHVIFENNDDQRLFLNHRLLTPQQATLIRGAGVDVRRYRPHPKPDGTPLVILPGRMLWMKGVKEFCEAAAMVRMSGVVARFALVGGLDPGNPTAIPESWLEEQKRAGVVEWWGYRTDMVPIYGAAHIVCLPSYGEGLPTVLAEAAICGCALVTSDAPGCREVVTDNETGLLVPPRDSRALALALTRMITDVDLRARLSRAAMRTALEQYNVDLIQSRTLQVYRELLQPLAE